ncbi:MAG: hypothetical protein M1821_002404 [Bathelium mastoideum]|nr:MAG: hypothetical protein M1821_002404 [Bathelium mastoideum]
MEASPAASHHSSTSTVNATDEATFMLDKSPRINASKPTKYQLQFMTKPLIFASAAAPLAILVWSVVDLIHRKPNVFQASVIGGHLTITQAKAVDFACSAILAPLAMVSLNYLWFRISRKSIIKLQKVPLASLLAASNIESGGYSPSTLLALYRSKTWSFCLFGFLFLFSGIANTTLSQFIAYEEFQHQFPAAPTQLKQLNDEYIHSLQFSVDVSPANILSNGEFLSRSNFTPSQTSNLVRNLTGLLTDLLFENAMPNLDAGNGYIGSNATQQSLNAVDQSITILKHIPAYRLTVDCQPLQPSGCQLSETDGYSKLQVFPSGGNGTDSGLNYTAYTPGSMNLDLADGNNDASEFPYIAFTPVGVYTQAYLGWLYTPNMSSMPSAFGSIQPEINIIPEPNGSNFTNAGISCTIMRQEGYVDYNRTMGQQWERINSSFSDTQTASQSFLGYWQTALDYQAPSTAVTGIGPAIAGSAGRMYSKDGSLPNPNPVNWTIYAHNYLYASGEAQRITYEIASESMTSSDTPTDYVYNVTGVANIPRYHITYIPILLLLGLVSLLVGATITCVLTFYAGDITHDSHDFNQLQLLVDGVVGLQHSDSLTAAEAMESKGLVHWAKKFRVGYSKVVEGDELVTRLLPEEGLAEAKI